MRRVLLALCVAATGCADLLSLDGVENASEDADRDGIRDSTDNCKGVENPDQADIDHDGIGDACDLLTCPEGVGLSINRDIDRDGIDDGCDSCRYGPPDDEEGDAIPDACDVCPGTSDPLQNDGDKDGVGDACDVAGTPQSRIFFDGFGSGPHGWVDPNWLVGGGALSRVKGNELQLVDNHVVFGNWYVQVGITVPTTAQAGHVAFIVLDDFTDRITNCGLSYNDMTGKFVLTAFEEPRPLFTGVKSIDPGAHVTLRAHTKGTDTLGCEILETKEATSVSLPAMATFQVMLRTNNPDVRFTHVELVR